MTDGAVQSVTPKVSLDVASKSVPSGFSNLAVKSLEIERVFGGAGSQATVKAIFDGFLSDAEKSEIQSFIDSGIRDDSFVEYGNPATRRANELKIEVDVRVTSNTGDGTTTVEGRIFTGTVTSVTENNERVVTFNALDKRHQLNRNMVQLDIDEKTPISTVVEEILTDKNGTGLALADDEYNIDVESQRTGPAQTKGGDIEVIGTYGVKAHATAFEVLQDLASKANATIHIDNKNVINFVQFPEHVLYTPETIPPIVEWESGDEETENDVIASSPYDETGIGLYAPIAREVTGDASSKTLNPGDVTHHANVFSRNAVENAREFELVSNELMKDSGTIRMIGAPGINPYDRLTLNDNAVNAFSPISEGTYMMKTVRHIIDNQNGYLTELELGKDPRELFKQFTGQSARSFTTQRTVSEKESPASQAERARKLLTYKHLIPGL